MKYSIKNLPVHRETPIFRVTFWLQLLLVLFTLRQSDVAAAAYRRGASEEEIDRSEEDVTKSTELKQNNGEQADKCGVSG